MTSRENIIYANKIGYHVSETGQVFDNNGKLLHSHVNKRKRRAFKIDIDGRLTYIEVCRLQGYQLFGKDTFKEGYGVTHSNGNFMDDSSGNIIIIKLIVSILS
tara:strand:- start:601 stop:909 length:309 start_codon:yes stop_codon:yes gene_type:complete